MQTRSFRVFSSFSSHVSRLHPGTLAENAYENNTVVPDEAQNVDMDVGTVSSEQISLQEELVSATEGFDCAAMLKLSAGQFIVRLKEQHLVSYLDIIVKFDYNLCRLPKHVLPTPLKVLLIWYTLS